jgi:hypothetical protein
MSLVLLPLLSTTRRQRFNLFLISPLLILSLLVVPLQSQPLVSYELSSDQSANCTSLSSLATYIANNTCINDVSANCTILSSASGSRVSAVVMKYQSNGQCNASYYPGGTSITVYSWMDVMNGTCSPMTVTGIPPNGAPTTSQSYGLVQCSIPPQLNGAGEGGVQSSTTVTWLYCVATLLCLWLYSAGTPF